MENSLLDPYLKGFEELESILNLSYDGITVADGNGVFRNVSLSWTELSGIHSSEIIGKSSSFLEKNGFCDISVTSEVLKAKTPVILTQQIAGKKKVLVTGIPIFDQDTNNIEKIINITKDITEMNTLTSASSLLQNGSENKLHKRTRLDRNNNSQALLKIFDMANHVADLPVTVLLLGETGVGKGFMAKLMHNNSKRKNQPFVLINSGAIPENLLESELFGYEKGAFTGASKEGKKGLFEIADNGTIFLDEIGDLPLSLQVKLLHVLDEKRARRIGGSSSYEVKARVIAATNKNLKDLVGKGQFREDLFYRLNIVPIKIPPLRERKEDIFFLTQSFLDHFNIKYETNKKLTEEAMRLLYDYDYPGNIRELENIIERLVIMTIGDIIDKTAILEVIEPPNKVIDREIIPLKEAVEQLERSLLLNAFNKYKTTRKVAEALQIDQSTVVKKTKKLNI
ncbi:sigma-54 interaction domain-containing protein [Neobacillus terrae]|uniref:sigma-54 interaction domain-containing protein n=1 Tax=Neobacillus terrae TaxID=3034837 RepID=UPI00140E5C1A|nr:sigma 54-interacting transcriptional regulator [Neobacillus terrae]NHM30697.1 sigma 54-interacting transcriptional regulator [Neobacillus terrae]